MMWLMRSIRFKTAAVSSQDTRRWPPVAWVAHGLGQPAPGHCRCDLCGVHGNTDKHRGPPLTSRNMNTKARRNDQGNVKIRQLRHAARLAILARRKHAKMNVQLNKAVAALANQRKARGDTSRTEVAKEVRNRKAWVKKAWRELHLKRVRFHTLLSQIKTEFYQRNIQLDALKAHLRKIGFDHDQATSSRLMAERKAQASRSIRNIHSNNTECAGRRECFLGADGIAVILEIIEAGEPAKPTGLRLAYVGKPWVACETPWGPELMENGGGYLPWDIEQAMVDKHDIIRQGRIIIKGDMFGDFTTTKGGLEMLRNLTRYVEIVMALARAIPLLARDDNYGLTISGRATHLAPLEERDEFTLQKDDFLVDAMAKGEQLWVTRIISGYDEFNVLLPGNMGAKDFAAALRPRKWAPDIEAVRIAKFP